MKNVRHRKRIFALLMAMALVGSAQAQLFNIDGQGRDGREKPEGDGIFMRGFGSGGGSTGGEITPGSDVSPLGSGIFLLAGMAGAYAFMRRKKDEE